VINVLKLMAATSKTSVLGCALLSLATGAANGLLLIIVSEVIATGDFFTPATIFNFFGVLCLFLIFRWATNTTIVGLVETLTMRFRLSVLDALQDCGLEAYETIGQARIHNALTEDCTAICRYIPDLIALVSSLITIVVCMGYLAWLSPLIFFMAAGLMAIGTALYLLRQQAAERGLSQARTQVDRVYKLIIDFLGGFKELKLSQAKRRDVFVNHIEPSFERSRQLRIAALRAVQFNYVLGLGLFFSFLALVLFYLPHRIGDDLSLVSRAAVILLYMVIPGGEFLYGALQMISLRIAVDNLETLRRQTLQGRSDPDNDGRLAGADTLADFDCIRLEQAVYAYPGDNGRPGFRVGPLTLELPKGQVVFVTGGNGSGKTTLCKLLTGLYLPQQGRILIRTTGGRTLQGQAYRHFLAAVFSDFYLFDRYYGIDPPPDPELEAWLNRLNLTGKVAICQGRLSTTFLSSGQRRRLALLACVLEDKPVMVLDELTADQEPAFRDYFYGTFVRQMKAAGKTLIIITHDDRYFHLADQIVKLDYGRLLNGPTPKT